MTLHRAEATATEEAGLDSRIAWFWAEFRLAWRAAVLDGAAGVFDSLDAEGRAERQAEKSLLVQARALFSLAEFARLTGDPADLAAAQTVAAILPRYRKPSGLYRRALRHDLSQGSAADDIARSYDQSFVILALATLDRLAPSPANEAAAEDLWQAIGRHLVRPGSDLLQEDDTGADSVPAQNPHMHLYEACLAAFEAWRSPRWLERARQLRCLALRHFLDDASGSICEWLAPENHRREPGHQAEWAWLLEREARLSGAKETRSITARLMRYLETHGIAQDGPLAGALHDALDADGRVSEATHLLWPQTEAVKAFAAEPSRHGRARRLMALVFARYFVPGGFYLNQLDREGRVIWPACLTRLMYHLLLALSEGVRSGLWPGPRRHGAEECRA